jgi:hypothetical protein
VLRARAYSKREPEERRAAVCVVGLMSVVLGKFVERCARCKGAGKRAQAGPPPLGIEAAGRVGIIIILANVL